MTLELRFPAFRTTGRELARLPILTEIGSRLQNNLPGARWQLYSYGPWRALSLIVQPVMQLPSPAT